MSNYVWGTSLSWNDYLQARSFVDDISTSGHEAGRSVSMEILRQTHEVIASNEALARENIRVREGMHREHMATIEASTDRIVGGLSAGFDRLSYDLQDVSSSIADLNATFHWGFCELIAGIGHMTMRCLCLSSSLKPRCRL